jgi:hypothetical protein
MPVRCLSASSGRADVEAEFGIAGESFLVHANEDGDKRVDVVVNFDTVLALVSA